MTRPTPMLDAAIRDRCKADGCTYPECLGLINMAGVLCRTHKRDATNTLRAALPWTPPPEVIEAMAEAIRGKHIPEISMQIYREEALAAYRAIPIVRELWQEERS